MHSADSRGRLRPEAEDPIRTVFQRDRDRVVHSKAFRRLKHKTQVFLAPTGDHYRTRLTHTLEVSQIARTIAKVLRLNEELTEAIALGHDLGHTPFGHAGGAGAPRARAGRLQSLRAESACGRRAGAGRSRAQPDVGGPERHRQALEGKGRGAGRREPGEPGRDVGGAGGPGRRHHRVCQPRHRRCRAGGDPPSRGAAAGARGRAWRHRVGPDRSSRRRRGRPQRGRG